MISWSRYSLPIRTLGIFSERSLSLSKTFNSTDLWVFCGQAGYNDTLIFSCLLKSLLSEDNIREACGAPYSLVQDKYIKRVPLGDRRTWKTKDNLDNCTPNWRVIVPTLANKKHYKITCLNRILLHFAKLFSLYLTTCLWSTSHFLAFPDLSLCLLCDGKLIKKVPTSFSKTLHLALTITAIINSLVKFDRDGTWTCLRTP